MKRRTLSILVLFVTALNGRSEEGAGPGLLTPWIRGVKVAPVSSSDQHSIHAYFNTSPESPDGRYVLFYASRTTQGHDGEIRIRERTSGAETVLARGVSTEDAHRAACQQWVQGGRTVVFHNVLPSGEWVVMAVDVASGKERILARGRQVGFGAPAGDVVPVYGPHWNPGEHRGLELVNVATGEIRATPLTGERVRKEFPELVGKQFGDRPLSIFFPLLSPDGTRVIFKLATPAGGDFRSTKASVREGLLVYDLRDDRITFMQERWGHPAWHTNSRDILNTHGRVIDSGTGKTRLLPGEHRFPGSHPSFGPEGTLFATDTLADGPPWNGPKGSWAVVVGESATGRNATLAQFDNSHGARSWRVSHPHPVFSPDGRRVYFNVSDGPWTRLHVADVSTVP
jgi:hypothetical protein